MPVELQSILLRNNWNNKKIVVAVSGGADSMVLAALLQQAGADMVLAHCNFGLRGTESDGDEALVVTWAEAAGVPVYTERFATREILEGGGNLQETARDLRYAWFESLRTTLGFDLVATGHHQQDVAETVLINLLKGTGIAGLHGILPQQGRIIRPLLAFTKTELLEFAAAHQVPWREDSSNKKDDYVRNQVRHHVLPLAENIVPGAVEHLYKSSLRLQEAELLYQESISRYRRKLIEQRAKEWYIPVLKIRHCRPLATILWELLKPFGFTAAQLPDLQRLLDAETGKYINSATHRIIRNRNFLIVTSLLREESGHVLLEAADREVATAHFRLDIREQVLDETLLRQIMSAADNQAAHLDYGKLEFPLILRPWKTGDYFYPLGMNHKKKKVSRFLIDQKVPLHEKEKIWVLESNKKIAWVIGKRIDERFKIGQGTGKIWRFFMKPV